MNSKRKLVRKQESTITFPESISGNLGSFVTPAGTIRYLSTKASLRFYGQASPADVKNERLTRFLAPVREVVNVNELGFDQLLQRDLDDNRIVHELIPYLLGSKRSGVPLFPPIVAMILPFDDSVLQKSFGKPTVTELGIDEYEGEWRRVMHGTAFCVDTSKDDSATPGFGIVRWNNEKAKLVVMDGQHRAMALLGIHRIAQNSWPADSLKFEVFYRERIEQLLSKYGKDKLPEVIELPVMIAWLESGSDDLPQVVRKLFVDINSNARLPSKSRILLLSDERLDNHITRHFLTTVRAAPNKIPLASIEYDYPNDGKKSIGRWSCYSNIEIIREIIHWLVFSKEKVLQRCDSDVMNQGRKSGGDFDIPLRKRLRVKDLGIKFDDGDSIIRSQEITNFVFPRYNKDKLAVLMRNFSDFYGDPLMELFSNTLPYRVHFDALRELEIEFDKKYGVLDEAKLCKEALFGGQGVFWTIRRGAEAGGSARLVSSWKHISEQIAGDFFRSRRTHYLKGKISDTNAKDLDKFFEQLRTTAAQGGLALLFGTLCVAANATSQESRVGIAKLLSKGISAGLANASGSPYILVPGRQGSINLVPKLEPRFAGLWRYLWFEVFWKGVDLKECKANGLEKPVLVDLLDQARSFYFKGLVTIRVKSLRKTRLGVDSKVLHGEAEESVGEDLIKAFVAAKLENKTDSAKIWKKACTSISASDGGQDSQVLDEDEDDDVEESEDDDGI